MDVILHRERQRQKEQGREGERESKGRFKEEIANVLCSQ